MKNISRIVFCAVIAIIVGGSAFLATWDIPARMTIIEKYSLMPVSQISKTSFFIKAVASFALVLLVLLQLAEAQNEPIRLAPPQKSRLGGQSAIKLPKVAPPIKEQQTLESGFMNSVGTSIQIDTLKIINPDTAGVLSAQEGGFGVGMWNGTSRRMLATMMKRLPVNIKSKAMRDLTRRLLLSTAVLPEGMAGDGSYIARRVGLLSSMGDTLSVNQLLDATPGRSQIEELVRYEADARFLANDNARACSLAARQISIESSAYWQKAFIFCQALAGEHDKAALGVSLLQDVGDGDEAFYSLVEALAGNPTKIESLPDPTPMHLSIARVTKTQLPNDVVASSRPGVLRTIAISPNASVEIRLEAAERAEISGALEVDTLRQLYTSVPFSEQDLANPLSKAEAESGPLSRALLYRTSLIETIPITQAEAVAKALSLGRQGGRYISIVRVFMPVLERISPSAELAWFAPEVIRAFLAGGEAASAAPWFSLLRANAQHNDESAQALMSLLPVARLAGSSETLDWAPNHLANWWEQTKKDEGASDKAALLYSLLDALGEDVPREAWYALLNGPQRITIAMPHPVLWHSLNEATKTARLAQEEPLEAYSSIQEVASSEVQTAQVVIVEPTVILKPNAPARIGEIVLLSLIALGEGGPAEAEPIVLSKVIESLSVVGLEDEVRALAIEAAVAAGL